jgi:hypothetical protein
MTAVYINGGFEMHTPTKIDADGKPVSSITTWGIRADLPPDAPPTQQATKYSISALVNNPNQPEIVEFVQQFEAIQAFFVREATKNSKEWFSKVLAQEIVQFNFKGAYNPGGEGKSPLFKFKVPYNVNDGTWKTEIYDHNATCLFSPNLNPTVDPTPFVPSNSSVALIVIPTKIWIVNNNWGVYWNLKECCVLESRSGNRMAFTGKPSFSFLKAPAVAARPVADSVHDSDDDMATEVQEKQEPEVQEEVQVQEEVKEEVQVKPEEKEVPKPVVKPPVVKRSLESTTVPLPFASATASAPAPVLKKKVIKKSDSSA